MLLTLLSMSSYVCLDRQFPNVALLTYDSRDGRSHQRPQHSFLFRRKIFKLSQLISNLVALAACRRLSSTSILSKIQKQLSVWAPLPCLS